MKLFVELISDEVSLNLNPNVATLDVKDIIVVNETPIDFDLAQYYIDKSVVNTNLSTSENLKQLIDTLPIDSNGNPNLDVNSIVSEDRNNIISVVDNKLLVTLNWSSSNW